jgi:hypothetical protein
MITAFRSRLLTDRDRFPNISCDRNLQTQPALSTFPAVYPLRGTGAWHFDGSLNVRDHVKFYSGTFPDGHAEL